MARRLYRSSIPAKAREKISDRFPKGAKKAAFFFLNGKKVGFREWNEDGGLEFEYGMRGDKKHGREYRFFEDNRPFEVTPYRNGVLHGTGLQWSYDGRVVISYTLVNGVGLDLWCSHQNESLSEEHYWPRDGELGYDREWNEDEKTIWQEYYFVNGKGYHGIWREWNEQGRLRRGFPHFFVEDRRVTKREYLKACDIDGTLLRYSPKDDDPHRQLPLEYRVQSSEAG